MNTLYDLPGQKLRRKGELLRLRRYGDSWRLTHKARAKAGRHKSRTELETGVSDGAQMEQILRALGYQPVFTYENFAPSGATGKATLCSTTLQLAMSPRSKAKLDGSTKLREAFALLQAITSRNPTLNFSSIGNVNINGRR